MQRLVQMFDADTDATATCDAPVAVYVSGSMVATAQARAIQQRPLQVALRADPLLQKADLKTLLAKQMASLGVRHSAARRSVNLVLAPEMYHLSLVDRPDVDDDQVVEAVRWQLQDQVDFPMESACLDVFEMPRGAARERRMVFAVTVQKELLRGLVEELSAANMRVVSVDASELALRNLAWHCYPHHDQNIAFLRLTANSGLINISRADELYLARRISGVPADFSDQQWIEFRERLLLQVQRSIDYYESAMNQPHCNMLAIASTHDWTLQVAEYLGEMLPIPVRTLDEVLADDLTIQLHNPEAVDVNWATLTADQRNALAAGLPALGGVLRHQIAACVTEAA